MKISLPARHLPPSVHPPTSIFRSVMNKKTLIRKINKQRFDALTYAKHPYAGMIGREVEWYSDSTDNVLGAVVLILTDNDWSWVVLGRDEAALFRAIDFAVSLPTVAKARKILRERMSKHSKTGKSTFPQGDVVRQKNLFAEPVVTSAKLCKHFKILLNAHHQAAEGLSARLALRLQTSMETLRSSFRRLHSTPDFGNYSSTHFFMNNGFY